jgi:hypothetical protein
MALGPPLFFYHPFTDCFHHHKLVSYYSMISILMIHIVNCGPACSFIQAIHDIFVAIFWSDIRDICYNSLEMSYLNSDNPKLTHHLVGGLYNWKLESNIKAIVVSTTSTWPYFWISVNQNLVYVKMWPKPRSHG